MNVFFQRCLIAVWFCTVTVASVGVSVHSLYCLCKAESTVSLFQMEHDCDHTPSKEVAKNCCSGGACAKSIDNKHDCGSSDVEFYKMEVPSMEPSFVKCVLSPHVLAELTPNTFFYQAAFLPLRKVSALTDRGPPVRSGQWHRIRLQSFLC